MVDKDGFMVSDVIAMIEASLNLFAVELQQNSSSVQNIIYWSKRYISSSGPRT